MYLLFVNVTVQYDNILDRNYNSNNFYTQETLCSDILVLPVYPGITGDIVSTFKLTNNSIILNILQLRGILKDPIKGVVLQCFGAGNIPTRPDVIEALREAVQAKILIVRVSLCLKGSVTDLYEVGAVSYLGEKICECLERTEDRDFDMIT